MGAKIIRVKTEGELNICRMLEHHPTDLLAILSGKNTTLNWTDQTVTI